MNAKYPDIFFQGPTVKILQESARTPLNENLRLYID